MIWIVIIIAVIVIWAISAASKANSPQARTANLQKWFEEWSEGYYTKVQEKLRKDFQTRYNKDEHWVWDSEKEYNERRNSDRVEFRENELWRRHVLTIMASDSYSFEAKNNAVTAWHDYIYAQDSMNMAIEIGLDTETMESTGRQVYESRSTLVGVMAAFNFDLEKETKALEKEIAEEFPVTKKKARKVVV